VFRIRTESLLGTKLLVQEEEKSFSGAQRLCDYKRKALQEHSCCAIIRRNHYRSTAPGQIQEDAFKNAQDAQAE
jgi:hypothetical protein